MIIETDYDDYVEEVIKNAELGKENVEVIRNGNVDDIDLFFRYESDGSLKRIVDVKGA